MKRFLERRHGNRCAQNCLPGANCTWPTKIRAHGTLPVRILGIANTHGNVPGAPSTQPLGTFAWHPNRLTGPDTGRNSDGVGFRLFAACAGIRCVRTAMARIPPFMTSSSVNKDVSLNITASLHRFCFISAIGGSVMAKR